MPSVPDFLASLLRGWNHVPNVSSYLIHAWGFRREWILNPPFVMVVRDRLGQCKGLLWTRLLSRPTGYLS
jgi:hypothetical protein